MALININFCKCTHSVTSDTLWPRGLWPTRLLCPWDFPGKNLGVGCHFLFQGIFSTQGSNLRLLRFLHWQAYSLPLGPPGKEFHKGMTQMNSANYWGLLNSLRKPFHHLESDIYSYSEQWTGDSQNQTSLKFIFQRNYAGQAPFSAHPLKILFCCGSVA